MRFGYYPGAACRTAWEYDRSLQAVAAALVWSCGRWKTGIVVGPVLPAHDRFLATALPAKLLGLAAQEKAFWCHVPRV